MRRSLLALAVALASAGCGDSAGGAGHWRAASSPPLGLREQALAVWTGREVLVLGGSDAAPCPPGADCGRTTRPPLRDGAAFDPRRRSWRRIAAAPVGFAFGAAVKVGGTVFVASPGDDSRPGAPPLVLAYDLARDRWRRLPPTPRPRHAYSLVAAGGRLVTYDNGGGGPGPAGWVLRRDRRAWHALPPAPLPATGGQDLAWTGRELVLIRSAYVGRQADRPPLARAAALHLSGGGWRRLPDSTTVLFGHSWVRVGSRLIDPELGDSGEQYRWGRPIGGVLDPRRGVWSDLPDPPEADPSVFGIGVLTPTAGTYFSAHGWVLDSAAKRWLEVPRLEGERASVSGRALTGAGRKLFVFGGARFDSQSPRGRLLNGVRIWSPPG